VAVVTPMSQIRRTDPDAFTVMDVLVREWLRASEMGRDVAASMVDLSEDELVESIYRLRDEGFLVFQAGDLDGEDISFSVWLAIDGEPVEES
jgi:hypothetical protein